MIALVAEVEVLERSSYQHEFQWHTTQGLSSLVCSRTLRARNIYHLVLFSFSPGTFKDQFSAGTSCCAGTPAFLMVLFFFYTFSAGTFFVFFKGLLLAFDFDFRSKIKKRQRNGGYGAR